MKHRNMLVYALTKLLALPLDPARDSQGRCHELHEVRIPFLNGTLESRYRPVIDTIDIESTQSATLN